MEFRLRKKGEQELAAPAGEEDGGSIETRGGRTTARETVRLSFRLPRELHTRLRLEAVRQGETIVELVSRWVEEQTAAA